ncbi:phage holin family protein [Pusillimonas sp. DMV24BSW_D]|uniref:phage holin family protein n=1 Tax=Neopusillimonas aestuarii TaxID=2716226 RepID=UPI0014096EE4|nr:phage holin family protein [Pusillimonas sp. DMV24BSW_D]QIM48876.1 phage holin family protein [Pusillimonas sp. DMV24BSW_D]
MALRQSAGQLAATLVSIVGTRLELFSIELAEQRVRLIKVMCLTVGAILCLVLALLVVSLLVALYFWPTEYRYVALGLLALVYLFVGLGLAWWVRKELCANPVPFEATLDELKRDLALVNRLQEVDRADRNPGDAP